MLVILLGVISWGRILRLNYGFTQTEWFCLKKNNNYNIKKYGIKYVAVIFPLKFKSNV